MVGGKISLTLSSYRFDEPNLLTCGCPVHSAPALHILPATDPPIRVLSCPPFTLQSHLPFHTPIPRPAYSPNCLPFFSSILSTHPSNPPPLTRHTSYPHFRISSNRITLQAVFPTGREHTKTIKHVTFYFPGLGQWTVREIIQIVFADRVDSKRRVAGTRCNTLGAAVSGGPLAMRSLLRIETWPQVREAPLYS